MRGISYSGAKNEMFLAARTDPPTCREMTIQGLVFFDIFHWVNNELIAHR